MKFVKVVGVVAIIMLLVGCSQLIGNSDPTPYPTEYIPTIIALTIEAGGNSGLSATVTLTPEPIAPTKIITTRKAAPTTTLLTPEDRATIVQDETPTQQATQFTPTTRVMIVPPLPTKTPTVVPTFEIPDAGIQIRDPGPLSKVVSPIRVVAFPRPGEDGRVRIELYGEDGRLLVRKIKDFTGMVGKVYMVEEIDFEIPGVGETGRLQISTVDEYNRLMELGSVEVVLLSKGNSDLNPSGNMLEPIVIQEPTKNKLVLGGQLLVSGLVRMDATQPLRAEVVTISGKTVGYRQATVGIPGNDGYAPFIVEIPYTVDKPTWVRLTVHVDSIGRIPGIVSLTSVEVLLGP